MPRFKNRHVKKTIFFVFVLAFTVPAMGNDLRELETLANQNIANAQTDLGYLYEKGIGVERDYAKALFLYNKAAKQGFASAQHHLGVMYENGQGVDQNYTKAFEWYSKAANQELREAQGKIGFFIIMVWACRRIILNPLNFIANQLSNSTTKLNTILELCTMRGKV